MNFDTLTLDVADGVATITLNRPDVGNAMSPVMAHDLAEVALHCDDNNEIRAVVITGSGRMFCAGGDLGSFAEAGADAKSMIKRMATELHVGLSRFTRTNAPVIAAVNGTAAGAGFSLCMSTDLAIAGESAAFTMAYTRAGLSPDGSSTYFMPRRIGDRRTRELMLTNRLLSAAEALEWGVVNKVVPDDQVLTEAQALAQQLAAGPTLAYGAVKSLLNGSFDQSLEGQMELESRAIAEMITTNDGQEGVAAFLAKRRPEFSGT